MTGAWLPERRNQATALHTTAWGYNHLAGTGTIHVSKAAPEPHRTWCQVWCGSSAADDMT